jgi:hypothetical protein
MLRKIEIVSKKDAHALKIHRGFIGLCFSGARKRMRVRCEKGKPAARWRRKA